MTPSAQSVCFFFLFFILYLVANRLPIAISDDALATNPNFAKLLSNLSEHINEDGIDQSLAQDYDRVCLSQLQSQFELISTCSISPSIFPFQNSDQSTSKQGEI